MKKLFLFGFALLGVISCSKKTEIIKEEPINPDAVINVLKDNSGFDTVFNVVQALGSANSAPPSINIADFTLETNNNFNIVYYTEFPSQQSVLANYIRFSKNLNTQAVISLPQYADNLKGLSPAQIKSDGLGLGIQQFKPYSNYFIYAVIRN
jgi:hypothetical protein